MSTEGVAQVANQPQFKDGFNNIKLNTEIQGIVTILSSLPALEDRAPIHHVKLMTAIHE